MQRHNALPNMKLSCIWPNCSNNTGNFVSKNGGLFDERKSTLAVENIAESNSACRNFHQHLPSFWQHDRYVAVLKGLGGEGWGGKNDSTHEAREEGGEFWHREWSKSDKRIKYHRTF